MEYLTDLSSFGGAWQAMTYRTLRMTPAGRLTIKSDDVRS